MNCGCGPLLRTRTYALEYPAILVDWLVANAGRYDLVIIVGDLPDLGSALDFDVQIVVVKNICTEFDGMHPYLYRSQILRDLVSHV